MLEITLEGEPLAGVAAWLEAFPSRPRSGGRVLPSERAMAKSWDGGEGLGLIPPAELLALAALGASEEASGFGGLRLTRGEVRLPLPRRLAGSSIPSFVAELVLEGEDAQGPVLLVVLSQGEEPCGERIENLLVASARSVAEERDSPVVEEIRTLKRLLLPPWEEGLPPLGGLRYPLLAATAGVLALAGDRGVRRVGLVVHEIVDLGRTREARRRSNREDLDRFVRRLTGGEVERLSRGVFSGPVRVAGVGDVELFLGKMRRDL